MKEETHARTRAEETTKVLKEIVESNDELNKRKTDESATNEPEDMEIVVETGVWIQQQKRKNLKIDKINRKQEKDLICTTCGITCDNQSEHEEHLKTHTQSKNYICQKCKNRFTKESELEKHWFGRFGFVW